MMETNHDPSEEFARLLSQCEKQLFSYILALVWNVQDAEDLYQQTAMTLWSKFDGFERGTDFPRWAFATARLVTSNFQRTQRRHREFLTPDLAATLADKQAALPAGEFDSLGTALVGCMDRLSQSDRDLVQLCYGEEQSIKEIADRLGRPAQSTYNSLFRIRRWLFDCIRQTVSRKADL
jgi:RNA polymerase sigma-70 factor (ECF subfamily)